MYIILLMLAVQIFLLCRLSHSLSDLFSLSCNRAVLWQCLVAPVALLLLLGDKEVLVVQTHSSWVPGSFRLRAQGSFIFLRTQHTFCMFVLGIHNLIVIECTSATPYPL